MINILVSNNGPRTKYIFEFIFKQILQSEYLIIKSVEEFENASGVKLIYASEKNTEGLFFQSCGLLEQEGIFTQKIEWVEFEGNKAFFPVLSGVFPFDPFAAAFYLVSRYEEYLPHEKDRHGRFSYLHSIAWKGGFLEKPVVNIWAHAIKKRIMAYFPEMIFPPPVFHFKPTIDIDNAFAYIHKGYFKNGMRLVSSLVSFRFRDFFSRLKVLMRLSSDPYDCYQKLEKVNEKYNLKPIYFVLLADRSRYDRNLSHTNLAYIKLIQTLRKKASVGIHPGYKTYNFPERFRIEKQRLEEILEERVEQSRNHYIRISLPQTYRRLEEVGIHEDYSMGYPSYSGFRAGTSTPFCFFDLEKNRPGNLKIIPFVFMDTTLKRYQKKRSENVLPYLSKLIRDVQEYGGCLTYIFHNESIGGRGFWRNWKNMYEDVVCLAIRENPRD